MDRRAFLSGSLRRPRRAARRRRRSRQRARCTAWALLSAGGVPDLSIPTMANVLRHGAARSRLRRGPKSRRSTADSPRTSSTGCPASRVNWCSSDVDVIVAVSGQAIQAVRRRDGDDPDRHGHLDATQSRAGLVASLARPGGNVTGVSTVAENSPRRQAAGAAERGRAQGRARRRPREPGRSASSAQLKEAKKAARGPAASGSYLSRFESTRLRRRLQHGRRRAVRDAIFIVMGPTLPPTTESRSWSALLKHRLAVDLRKP